MASITSKKRIWGWMAFDWATQPFYTSGLTFIFGPYFAVVAAQYFAGTGLNAEAASAQASSTWFWGQAIAGLVIAFTAPFLGAFSDSSGRKIPWIIAFSVIYVVTSFSLWWLFPDGSTMWVIFFAFWVGFVAAESALNFINAILPSLGTDEEIGRISGSGAAFGYWGGVTSLFIMLIFFSEDGTGQTMVGLTSAFGLDQIDRGGTRIVGPFIAIWYAVFMIPFFLYVRDDPNFIRPMPPVSKITRDLGQTLKNVWRNKSLSNFLIGSMLYRDALNAVYTGGGVYAALVLGWGTTQIGIFGIIAAITAAILTYVGGRCDARFGPKPVITVCIFVLVAVSIVIVGMSRESMLGLPFAPNSQMPDIIFFICGAALGGAGGAIYAASRSMMSRHTNPERPTEAFGLFALSGKATAFLAPALIGLSTQLTGSVRLGFLPVILLFFAGLVLLRFVKPEGDRL
ncbi:MFS transporter [Algirhabdus cladophorae]|uniref:MFS transporter n=1 Tax=Algirhabdus cladophorae TaxID=3377108 RepID=UPI003B84A733